jgi:predicted glycoside hydrolase/deacetylase ChbG (UPF0249 family)
MGAVKRLVVNADDFGRTPGVNQGIVEAHRRGVVTSTTMMVAYPAAEEAARLARDNPRLGVGLHLAVTGGAPILPASQVPSLVDALGRFAAKPEGLSAVHPYDVLAEARAQLKRFRELMGRLPTHLDSHHHSHQVPAVLEAVVTIAWETGLPVRSLSYEMRSRLRREGIPTTDRFVQSFFDQGVSTEGLLRLLGDLGAGTTELMCHPAIVDDELRAASGYAEPRTRELEVLTRADVRQAIAAAGIRLISFAEL